MIAVIRVSWALFLGMFLLMAGQGLQGSLLGVRASIEGFSTLITGLLMSGYFAGYMTGSLAVPRFVANVGHIRVFAALASLASTSILVHAVFADPWVWTGMRFITGFAFAGLYIVAESWLNDRATNQTRGQLMSIYMVIQFAGLAGAQALLPLADPEEFQLFVLVSITISLALVPITLNRSEAPAFEVTEKVGLLTLYRISPLAVVGMFWCGAGMAMLFSMAAVFAAAYGFGVEEIAIFIGIQFTGGMLLQWPIGRLSDRFDRRKVLALVALAAGLVAVATVPSARLHPLVLFVAIGLLGGFAYPLYALIVSHANDHLKPEQMVPASGTLVLITGIGAIFGPIATAVLMEAFGPLGFFWGVSAAHLAVAGFAVWRMARSAPVPLDEQAAPVPVPVRGTSLGMAIAQEAVRDDRDMRLARLYRR